jgi:hypothetical protein
VPAGDGYFACMGANCGGIPAKQAGETTSNFSSIDKPDLSWARYPRRHGEH